ncbi:hypothetical protein NESM_000827400 [Novymonas esmeraldas]|uniref:Uncharacterized protein n=1 Tax=Novymonas esmeraldas TaxID=1808958 RepID=A0AAW0EX00_9TRYP
MEKVVLTTYRKLHRMCRRVDASVAMRTQLMCCPLQVYDHRSMEWEPFPLSKMEWAESRVYLDALIRRLNNGDPRYIPPLPTEAAHAVQVYKDQCASAFRTAAEVESVGGAVEDEPATGPATAAETATVGAAEGTGADAGSCSATATSDGARGATVPLSVEPFSTLTLALRQLYESTPFSMGNIANAFAAVKELQYVCDLDDAGRAKLVTLSAASSSGMSSAAADVPQLRRSLTVSPLHNSLIHGLTADQRISLDRHKRRAKKRAPSSRKVNRPPASTAAPTAAVASTSPPSHASAGSSFDDAPLEEAEHADAADNGEADAAAAEGGEPDASTESPGVDAAAASTSAELGDVLPGQAEMAEEPKEVQLLLAHPTARGFFKHTVLLVVRHVPHESAALVLNKPLRNEEGLEMSIEATVRLGRVHPIFRRHLVQHTLMIGGPVMSGSSFDESIFLLHRVPGIPHALPLGSSLWLDGDLDALMAKLDAKEASAEDDIVVLCGFAGWGCDQLKGELGHGYWVVGGAPSTDASVGGFVLSLAQATGGRHHHHQHHPPAADAASSSSTASAEGTSAAADAPSSGDTGPRATAGTSVAAADDTEAKSDAGAMTAEDRIRAEAQRAADAATSHALPSLKRRRRRAAGSVKMHHGQTETLSWVRAYASVGPPYADMAMNQKASANDDYFED